MSVGAEAGGTQVVVHAGLHALGRFADRIGFSASLSAAIPWAGERATTGGGMVVLDIDASLVQIHSENKAGAGPNYKGEFGFSPMLCFAEATGEALAGMVRPGNAGANRVADHFTVLDSAVAQLPVEIAVGHRDGDDVTTVRRAVQVRTDSAGCSTRFRSRVPCTQHRVRGRGPLQRQHPQGDQLHPTRQRALAAGPAAQY